MPGDEWINEIFFDDLLSGEDGVDVKRCAAFWVGDCFSCTSNLSLFIVCFFETQVIPFLHFFD